MSQTREDKQYILNNLADSVKRIQVVTETGKQLYKRPEEVDLDKDEIGLSPNGAPIVMKGKPGRKPKVKRQAVSPQVAQVVQARDQHISGDNLTCAVDKDYGSDKVIEGILQQLAKDAASIDFEVEEAIRCGGDVSALITKKSRILKGMSDIWLRKKSLDDGGMIEIDSPIFEALFSLILETFKEVLLASGVHDEHIETIFAKLVGQLDDNWKEEGKRRMRQVR